MKSVFSGITGKQKILFLILWIYVLFGLLANTLIVGRVAYITLTSPTERSLFLDKLPLTLLLWLVGAVIGVGVLLRKRWGWWAGVVVTTLAIIGFPLYELARESSVSFDFIFESLIYLVLLLLNKNVYLRRKTT